MKSSGDQFWLGVLGRCMVAALAAAKAIHAFLIHRDDLLRAVLNAVTAWALFVVLLYWPQESDAAEGRERLRRHDRWLVQLHRRRPLAFYLFSIALAAAVLAVAALLAI